MGPKLYGSIITQKPKMVLSPRSFIFKPNTMQAIEIKMALLAKKDRTNHLRFNI